MLLDTGSTYIKKKGKCTSKNFIFFLFSSSCFIFFCPFPSFTYLCLLHLLTPPTFSLCRESLWFTSFFPAPFRCSFLSLRKGPQSYLGYVEFDELKSHFATPVCLCMEHKGYEKNAFSFHYLPYKVFHRFLL